MSKILIDAILAEPAQQEPVAWLVACEGDSALVRHTEQFPGIFAGSEFNKRPLVFGDTSLPAQQEPFAWANKDDLCADTAFRWCEIGDHKTPVYTTPQPAQPQLITHEQHIALREAFAIGASDSYFEANPTHDNEVGRMLLERGFARGFDSYARALEVAHNIKENT